MCQHRYGIIPRNAATRRLNSLSHFKNAELTCCACSTCPLPFCRQSPPSTRRKQQQRCIYGEATHMTTTTSLMPRLGSTPRRLSLARRDKTNAASRATCSCPNVKSPTLSTTLSSNGANVSYHSPCDESTTIDTVLVITRSIGRNRSGIASRGSDGRSENECSARSLLRHPRK